MQEKKDKEEKRKKKEMQQKKQVCRGNTESPSNDLISARRPGLRGNPEWVPQNWASLLNRPDRNMYLLHGRPMRKCTQRARKAPST